MNSILENLIEYSNKGNLNIVRCSIREDEESGTAIIEGSNGTPSEVEWNTKSGEWE